MLKHGKSLKLAYIVCNTPTTIARFGAGFSGSLVATHLLKTANRPLLIKLIERDRDIGKGVAYSTTNSPVGLLTIDLECALL
ncbi:MULTISPECIES: FAD/NAD(P)-binding protein [unclassified Microcoleus]|uniref:FAD/NAD(P)-binding protein n=1 Tax=unclassified Microcoleus TaxID=2642155 RepID=UPI002FD13872